MERLSIETDRGNAYRDTLKRDVELRSLKSELREVEGQLVDIGRAAGKVLEIAATALLKPLEVVADLFSPPRELKPGEVLQQKEDTEQKIDIARFRTDPTIGLKCEREQRRTYERTHGHMRERDLDRQR